MANMHQSSFARRVQERPETVSAAEILAQPRDPLVAEVVSLAGDMLARAVGSILMSLAPEFVVLGGGVMDSGEALLERLVSRLSEYTIPEVLEQTRIVKASLGAKAGAIGAALYARDSTDE